MAGIVLLGIALPPVGVALRPFAGEAIFLLLVLAFLRADLSALKRNLTRPGLVLAATGWSMFAVPALASAALLGLGVETRAPELFAALMLQALASPVMSAPAFAALMGLDATLTLAVLILSSALVPFTAPGFAAALGLGVQLSPLALGAKLGLILAGSAFVALLLRRWVSPRQIERRRDEIDGLNIAILYIFVAALTSNFAEQTIAAPLRVAGLTALAFGIYFVLVALTVLLFRRAGTERAFAIAVASSQRNMGLMLAATGGALPELVWLYFAVAQFPIYLAPLMLGPVLRRLVPAGAGARA
ncbi:MULTISPECIES: Na+-dependent transporter [Rhodomicrobium]|uniref:Na+-dependent transporter n=1 Tax=Rhodomicrobium TaxID=1068 RepID=UPI001FD9C400|nr:MULTISPECIES: Na+-dependent transporter [Rhodomicrobium]